MNLPNKITIARIVMLPFFMYVMLVPDWGTVEIWGQSLEVNYLVGTVVFLTASLTDWIDGYLARKYKLVTSLGKFLDPLADKLLISIALIILVELQIAPSWIVALIIAREFAVTGIRLILANEGEVVAAATLGKIKTCTQIVAVSICLLQNFPFSVFGIPADLISLYVALIFTLWSGWDIFWVNRQAFLKSN